MKKLFLILGLLSTLFISCGKDDDKATLELSAKSTIVDVANTASTISITVETNQKTWTATENAEWINTKPSNKKLDIEISANETNSVRQADIIFKAGNATKKITIKQAAGTVEKPTLSISPEGTIEVAAKGDDKYVTVTTNQSSWEGSEDVDWITLSKEDNSLIIKVAENKTPLSRQADITITAGSLSKIVKISQAGAVATITLDPTSLEVNNTKNNYSVKVQSTFAWSVDYQSAEWFTLTADTNKNELNFEVSENTSSEKRVINVTVKDEYGTSTIFTLSQLGKSSSLEYQYDKIPVGNTVFTSSRDELIEWEKTRGTDADSNSTATILTFLFDGENPIGLVKREYVLYSNGKGFSEGQEVYTKVDQFFTEDKLSDNFTQQYKKQGYQLINSDGGRYTLLHNTGMMVIIVKQTHKGSPAVNLRYIPGM